MKTSIATRIAAAVALCSVALAGLHGCGGSTGTVGTGGTGQLAVHMSDGGGNGITAFNITVTKIQANIDGQWQTISTTPQALNLLDLQNTDILLGTATVPAGTYSQVRIFVSDATVTDSTGTHTVIIPSGAQTGIKINLNFTVPQNQLVGLLLDFNVAQSLVIEGNGTYRLKPVIPAVVQILSGTVTGTVSDAGGPVSGATVTASYTAGTAYPIGTIVNTTTTQTDGTFKVWALMPGTYTFNFTFTNSSSVIETATVPNVVVTADQNTDIGPVVIAGP
jgi:hypothetical protein